jgi:transcriptional regulator with XRE-family HTH domain
LALKDRIRELRKAQGLSQEKLARQADLSLNLIGRLEGGQVTDPHYSTLRGLARALGVPVEDLVREPTLAGKAEASETGPPRVGKERLEEHFEDVRQDEVDYLNRMIADFWRLALPDAKPKAHFVPDDIDGDRVWQFLEHTFSARNVFEPEEIERIKRGAVRKAALAR